MAEATKLGGDLSPLWRQHRMMLTVDAVLLIERLQKMGERTVSNLEMTGVKTYNRVLSLPSRDCWNVGFKHTKAGIFVIPRPRATVSFQHFCFVLFFPASSFSSTTVERKAGAYGVAWGRG